MSLHPMMEAPHRATESLRKSFTEKLSRLCLAATESVMNLVFRYTKARLLS